MALKNYKILHIAALTNRLYLLLSKLLWDICFVCFLPANHLIHWILLGLCTFYSSEKKNNKNTQNTLKTFLKGFTPITYTHSYTHTHTYIHRIYQFDDRWIFGTSAWQKASSPLQPLLSVSLPPSSLLLFFDWDSLSTSSHHLCPPGVKWTAGTSLWPWDEGQGKRPTPTQGWAPELWGSGGRSVCVCWGGRRCGWIFGLWCMFQDKKGGLMQKGDATGEEGYRGVIKTGLFSLPFGNKNCCEWTHLYFHLNGLLPSFHELGLP